MWLRFGELVARHWLAVILLWVAAVIGLRWLAPNWDDITLDGDLAYLPADVPSLVGERLLEEAFQDGRPKSQIAIYLARESAPLSEADFAIGYDLARRFENLQAAVHLTRAKALLGEAGSPEVEAWLDKAAAALDEAIDFDESLKDFCEQQTSAATANAGAVPAAKEKSYQPLAAAYFNRSLLHALRGNVELAAADRAVAVGWQPELASAGDQPFPANAADWPLLDVWNWRDDKFGKMLGSGHKHARLLILQLSNEFMATDNIRLLDQLEVELAAIRETIPAADRESLQIGFSGSAAVGGDILRASKDSIQHTELFTVLMVVVILGFVYRSPLLVVLPLVTITASLWVACDIVALLTQLNLVPGFDWWTLHVFTTTKIFIVVILFGAGTDYFLFLVARYKEELESGGERRLALPRALAGVSDALAASALTTILGLATMFFADFGKFSNSGPVIGLCLTVTLLACLTLAPALLVALGGVVFWPGRSGSATAGPVVHRPQLSEGLWRRLARMIVARPGLILVLAIAAMLPLAYRGWFSSRRVTYDFLQQLPDDRPSKIGAKLMQRQFHVGEGGPLVVVARRPSGGFDTKEGRLEIGELAKQLYLDGVKSVRCIADPLGDFPPDRKFSLSNLKSLRKLVASPHPRTLELFVSTSGPLAGKVTRLDLVLDSDPFSAAAEEALDRVEAKLAEIHAVPDSPWHDTEFAFAGTTAGIRDLKRVTQADNTRIEILVVLAVLAVLLVILKRPLACVYMILTVLFSFYVTIGATEWLFAVMQGAEFQGLDWKVPLFLFVILVAVGEDYNVYLATRVFEEQKRLGLIAGLQHAVERTGGIITSCGVIMAGTFAAMTSGVWGAAIPDWLPWLQDFFTTQGGALPSIVQLGFALSLGVLLDTFIVRTILVPAFFAILCRWRRAA